MLARLQVKSVDFDPTKRRHFREQKPCPFASNSSLSQMSTETGALPGNILVTAAPLLSFDNVVKDYTNEGERVRALDGVSLEIQAGAFVALVGRSGCGKSTLLHLAGALDFPTSGHVRLDGMATDQLSEAGLTKLRRENFGFVFQSFQLLNTLSVVENVEI